MSTSVSADTSWARVGEVLPTSLTDARLQLHHAVQVAVSATISYLSPRADDSHTALQWVAPVRALVTDAIPGVTPCRVGVRPRDLTLLTLDETMGLTNTFALAGRTLGDAHGWLAEITSAAGLDKSRLTSRKHYTIADHPVASGAAFSLRGSEFIELERYVSNAARIIGAVAATTRGASPVRCWPHHFDVATLIALPATTENSRTIGVGHSPGDEWYPEPYWYVGPYPSPDQSQLPALVAGHWHTQGWVGAALPASAYVTASAVDQREQVTSFIESGVTACRRLLEG